MQAVQLQFGQDPAAARRVAAGAGGTGDSGVEELGSGVCATPGLPIWPASQGSDEANTWAANGQVCPPGVATTAQAIPFARPSAHSELAAWV
jgi:hypothetical protein